MYKFNIKPKNIKELKPKGGKDMSLVQKIALVFTIIGALNWGLIGLFDFDLVAFIFGDMSTLTRIIYSIVGVSGVINLALLSVPTE